MSFRALKQAKSILALTSLILSSFTHADGKPARLEINTTQQSLTVWSAEGKILRQFGNISTGSGGIKALHFQGDESTPTGHFKVLWINPRSRFRLFFGLNYPTPEHAREALKAKKLSVADYRRIVLAEFHGQKPPFDTALGGDIGIHGIGGGNRLIHDNVNWTNGCVALNNEEIRELQQWVQIGTPVEIHP